MTEIELLEFRENNDAVIILAMCRKNYPIWMRSKNTYQGTNQYLQPSSRNATKPITRQNSDF